MHCLTVVWKKCRGGACNLLPLLHASSLPCLHTILVCRPYIFISCLIWISTNEFGIVIQHKLGSCKTFKCGKEQRGKAACRCMMTVYPWALPSVDCWALVGWLVSSKNSIQKSRTPATVLIVAGVRDLRIGLSYRLETVTLWLQAQLWVMVRCVGRISVSAFQRFRLSSNITKATASYPVRYLRPHPQPVPGEIVEQRHTHKSARVINASCSVHRW